MKNNIEKNRTTGRILMPRKPGKKEEEISDAWPMPSFM